MCYFDFRFSNNSLTFQIDIQINSKQTQKKKVYTSKHPLQILRHYLKGIQNSHLKYILLFPNLFQHSNFRQYLKFTSSFLTQIKTTVNNTGNAMENIPSYLKKNTHKAYLWHKTTIEIPNFHISHNLAKPQYFNTLRDSNPKKNPM